MGSPTGTQQVPQREPWSYRTGTPFSTCFFSYFSTFPPTPHRGPPAGGRCPLAGDLGRAPRGRSALDGGEAGLTALAAEGGRVAEDFGDVGDVGVEGLRHLGGVPVGPVLEVGAYVRHEVFEPRLPDRAQGDDGLLRADEVDLQRARRGIDAATMSSMKSGSVSCWSSSSSARGRNPVVVVDQQAGEVTRADVRRSGVPAATKTPHDGGGVNRHGPMVSHSPPGPDPAWWCPGAPQPPTGPPGVTTRWSQSLLTRSLGHRPRLSRTRPSRAPRGDRRPHRGPADCSTSAPVPLRASRASPLRLGLPGLQQGSRAAAGSSSSRRASPPRPVRSARLHPQQQARRAARSTGQCGDPPSVACTVRARPSLGPVMVIPTPTLQGAGRLRLALLPATGRAGA